MKWTIPELRKLRTTGNRFAYESDFARFLSDDGDVLAVSPVHISGAFRVLQDPDEFIFDVTVECTLTMACAITLAEVAVPLSFTTSLRFAEDPADDEALPVDGMTIDLDPYIWGEILIERPMRVLADGAYDGYVEEHVDLDDPTLEETANPFAGLKKPQA